VLILHLAPKAPPLPTKMYYLQKKAVTLKFLAVTVTLLQLHAVSKLGPKLEIPHYVGFFGGKRFIEIAVNH
jgi:hypothetical protein